MQDKDITIDMLDKNSQEFIHWFKAKFSDPEYMREYILESIRDMKNFWSRNPEELIALMEKKSLLGGWEHGDPLDIPEDAFDKEIQNEYLDIPLWRLVHDFNREKRASGTTQ